MSLLEFRASLRYRSGFQFDVEFVTDAPVTALFGPSGSGKTTALSLIAGLRRPDRGSIRLRDRVFVDRAQATWLAPERRRVGYVLQEHLLFPHLRVEQNLRYGWRRRPGDARSIDFERLIQVLELNTLLQRFPQTLSGGQRQRVALGRALLCGPELLLLDEPLVSVDEELRGRVLEDLERILNEWRIPIVYVTHTAEEVRRLAQRVIVLAAGRAVAAGSPAEVL